MSILNSRVSRRHFLAGAGAAAGVITLSACGSESGGGDDALVMTVWGGDVDKEAYQARLDLLTAAHPDLAVTLQLIPSDQYAQKVQTMIAGGDGPDIMQVAENVNVYSSKNQLVQLDDMISGAGIDLQSRFGPVGNIYSFQDGVYAMPDRSGAMIVYYNKTLFDEAGIDAPSAEWTWDDMLDAAKELTVPGERWGYAGAGWWAQWWSFVYQNGGAIIDPESGRPTVNTPEVIEALQWAGDLIFKHHVVPTQEDYANMGPDMGGDPAFAAGTVAMNTTGFWAIGGLTQGDIEWDIAPLWRGDEQAVTAFGSGLAISRDSANPDKAFQAISFLSDIDAQQVIIDKGQDVPANVEVQTSDAFLEPEWMTEPKNMGAFGESSEFIYRAPFIPEWNEMQQAFTDGLADFWLGTADAASSLEAIQGRLETIIQPAE